MLTFTLETLVLRGVVRTGELGVLRLFGVEATQGLPGDSNHPVLPPARTGPDADPVANPMVGYATKGISPRAGRSCRQIEGPSRRQQIVSHSGALSWRQQIGGSARAAAAIARALAAWLSAASVVEVSPRLAVLSLGAYEERSR